MQDLHKAIGLAVSSRHVALAVSPPLGSNQRGGKWTAAVTQVNQRFQANRLAASLESQRVAGDYADASVSAVARDGWTMAVAKVNARVKAQLAGSNTK